MIRLDSLTGLRAVLAALVLIVHSCLRVGWLDSNNWVKGTVGAFGHFGVVGFFILSGFILTIVYEGRSWTLREFFVNRFARIYPLYLLGILVALPIDWFSPGYPAGQKLEALALSFVCLQSWFEYANGRFNGPGWTLSVEFFFYLMFPLLFWIKSKQYGVFLALCLGLFIYTVCVWNPHIFNGSFRLPLLRLWEFTLGMILASCYMKPNFIFKLRNHSVFLFVLIGPILAYYLVLWTGWDFSKWLWMAMVSCFIILGLARADKENIKGRFLASKWWVYAGEISFGLYLLHDPIQRYVKVFVERVTGTKLYASELWVQLGYILVTVVLSLLSAMVVYKLVEIPARKFLRQKLSKS